MYICYTDLLWVDNLFLFFLALVPLLLLIVLWNHGHYFTKWDAFGKFLVLQKVGTAGSFFSDGSRETMSFWTFFKFLNPSPPTTIIINMSDWYLKHAWKSWKKSFTVACQLFARVMKQTFTLQSCCFWFQVLNRWLLFQRLSFANHGNSRVMKCNHHCFENRCTVDVFILTVILSLQPTQKKPFPLLFF